MYTINAYQQVTTGTSVTIHPMMTSRIRSDGGYGTGTITTVTLSGGNTVIQVDFTLGGNDPSSVLISSQSYAIHSIPAGQASTIILLGDQTESVHASDLIEYHWYHNVIQLGGACLPMGFLDGWFNYMGGSATFSGSPSYSFTLQANIGNDISMDDFVAGGSAQWDALGGTTQIDVSLLLDVDAYSLKKDGSPISPVSLGKTMMQAPSILMDNVPSSYNSSSFDAASGQVFVNLGTQMDSYAYGIVTSDNTFYSGQLNPSDSSIFVLSSQYGDVSAQLTGGSIWFATGDWQIMIMIQDATYCYMNSQAFSNYPVARYLEGSPVDLTPLDSDAVVPVPGNSGTLTTSNVAGIQLTLNWRKASDNLTRSEWLSYRAYYSTSSNLGSVADIEANGTPIGAWQVDYLSVNVTGLSPLTPYYFNVIVKDQSENKAAYTMKSQTTADARVLTWTSSPFTTSTSNVGWLDLVGSSDGSIFYAINSDWALDVIYKSSNAGVTWTSITIPQGINGIGFDPIKLSCSSDGTKVVVSMFSGYSVKSADGGTTWSSLFQFGNSGSATSDDGQKILLAGSYLYLSNNGGGSFTQLTAQGTRGWNSVACSSTFSVMAATSANGNIYVATAGVWNARGPSKFWVKVSCSKDGQKLIAFTAVNEVYKSADSGLTWTQSTLPANEVIADVRVSGDGSTMIVATKNAGHIWVSFNDGSSWSSMAGGVNNQLLRRFWYTTYIDNSGAYVMGFNRFDSDPRPAVLNRTTDGGGSWLNIFVPVRSHLTRMVSSADGTKVLGSNDSAYDGQIYLSTNAGVAWSNPTVPNPTTIIEIAADLNSDAKTWGSSSSSLYVGQTFIAPEVNMVKLSVNLKQNFGSPVTGTITAKLYAVDSEELPDPNAFTTSSTFDVSALTSSYQMVDFTFNCPYLVAGTKYAVTLETGAGLSTDIRIQISPSGNRYADGHLIVYSGGVWGTTNAANQDFIFSLMFTETAPLSRWSQFACSSEGTKMYAANLNGSLYSSTDSGSTWSRITIGSYYIVTAIGVACTADGTKIVFAAGDGNPNYVYISTDSGATWSQQVMLGSGNDSFDLVFCSPDGGTIYVKNTDFSNNRDFLSQSIDDGLNWGSVLEVTRSYLLAYTVGGATGSINWAALCQRETEAGYDLIVNGTTLTNTPWLFGSSIILFSPDGTVLTVANPGGFIYTTMDNGGHWTYQAPGPVSWQGLATNNAAMKMVASAADKMYLGTAVITSGTPDNITSGNSEVTGVMTWGNGSALTLNVNGIVRSSGDLTLDITDLDQIVAVGADRYIIVEAGGKIHIRNRHLNTVRGQAVYRLHKRV